MRQGVETEIPDDIEGFTIDGPFIVCDACNFRWDKDQRSEEGPETCPLCENAVLRKDIEKESLAPR